MLKKLNETVITNMGRFMYQGNGGIYTLVLNVHSGSPLSMPVEEGYEVVRPNTR